MLEIQNTAARSLTEIILVLEKVFCLPTWLHHSEGVFELGRSVSSSYWMTDVESAWK